MNIYESTVNNLGIESRALLGQISGPDAIEGFIAELPSKGPRWKSPAVVDIEEEDGMYMVAVQNGKHDLVLMVAQ